MTVTDAITAFKAGALSGPRLLRALVEHDHWRVPGIRNETGNNILMSVVGEERWLQLFSDPAACALYQQKMVDTPLTFIEATGAALFASLDDGLTGINLNPESSTAIHYRQHQFAELRDWGMAREVERVLDGTSRHPDPFGLLLSYEGYRLISRAGPEGQQIALTPDQQHRRLAAVFTAPDTADRYITAVQGALDAPLEVSRIDGRTLYLQLSELPLDGIVYNCAGPVAPKAVSKSFASLILGKGIQN